MFELKIVVQVEDAQLFFATVLGKHIHNCGYKQLLKPVNCGVTLCNSLQLVVAMVTLSANGSFLSLSFTL